MPLDARPVPMSATDYAARAQAALDAAAACQDEMMIAEWRAMAVEWQRLAELTDWHETMRAEGHLT